MEYTENNHTKSVTKIARDIGIEGTVIKSDDCDTKYSLLADHGALVPLGDTIAEATAAVKKLAAIGADVAKDTEAEPVDAEQQISAIRAKIEAKKAEIRAERKKFLSLPKVEQDKIRAKRAAEHEKAIKEAQKQRKERIESLKSE